jgi:hypothetical protein
MCTWPKDYANEALLLIGRVAIIPDDKLEMMIAKGQEREIISALDAK